MASIRPSKNKDGEIISYSIRVFRGYDENGKQLKPYIMTWRPPTDWSPRAIKRELTKVAGEFETACNRGEILTKEEQRDKTAQEKLEAAQKPTLRTYVRDYFMPAKSAIFSENARDNYDKCFNNRIFPELGEMKMIDIKPLHISKFLVSLQTTFRVLQTTKNGSSETDKLLSYSTVLKHYTVLHSLFNSAYMDDVITVNPMDKVARPKRRKDELPTEMEAYTVEETRHIMSCLDNEPLLWRTYIRLLIDTGARRGELCGLRWSDINFNDSTITISNNLQYTPQKGVYTTTPKGKKKRKVDIAPDIVSLLLELQAVQAEKELSPYCFAQDTGAPIHPQCPTRYFERFGEKYSIDHFHPHKLRHTAATIAITHGADIASVSAKLGHAETSTTLDMYTHANQDNIKHANEIYRKAIYGEE